MNKPNTTEIRSLALPTVQCGNPYLRVQKKKKKQSRKVSDGTPSKQAITATQQINIRLEFIISCAAGDILQ